MKKFLPYILILVILAGAWSPASIVNAQRTYANGTCVLTEASSGAYLSSSYAPDDASCQKMKGSSGKVIATWYGPGQTVPAKSNLGLCTAPTGTPPETKVTTHDECTIQHPGWGWNTLSQQEAAQEQAAKNQDSGLYDKLDSCAKIWSASIQGCVENIIYILFVSIPSFLLTLVAQMFNFLAALTISPDLYKLSFIEKIWRVIRDLSNIFFIIVLLYTAIQTILDMGHGGAKRAIANVIVIALVVNFSLFATKVVIDASNILALIFYNKIEVKNNTQKPISDPERTKIKETNLAGALASGFNMNVFFSPDLINKLELQKENITTVGNLATVGGATAAGATVGTLLGPAGSAAGGLIGAGVGGVTGALLSNPQGLSMKSVILVISMMVAYGLVVYALAYALFITALSFLGRMMMLIMLMIISPFAFVSFSVPLFKRIDKIGFSSWIRKLFDVAFSASIFMFILYVASEILRTNIFAELANQESANLIHILVTLFLPAILLTILLLAGAKYTKKAAGEFSEKIVGIGKTVAGAATGLVIGGGVGLAASGLQGTLGHLGKKAFESKTLAEMETSKATGFRGWSERRLGSVARTIGGSAAKSSFDLRKGVTGAALGIAGKATGFNLGAQSKFLLKETGGYEADLKRRDDKRKKRAEGLKIKEGEEEKQHLNKVKDEQQDLIIENEHAIHNKEREITAAEGKVKVLKDIALSANKEKDAAGNYIDKDYEKKQQEYRDAADAVKKLKGERSAIKDGMRINPKTGEYNTHNGNISKKGMDALVAAEASAIEKAAADPTNAALTGAAKVAKAMASAAKAAKAVSDAEKAAVKAAKNPKNAALAAASQAAELAKTKAMEEAREATRDVELLAMSDNTFVNAAEASREFTKKAEKGLGNSQNDYEDHLVPDAEHEVKKVSDTRVRAFATNLENQWAFPWNKAARRKSAHEIRMGAKPEKDHGGGGHGGAGAHFLGDLLAATVAEKVVGGHDHAPAADHGTAADHGDHGGGH